MMREAARRAMNLGAQPVIRTPDQRIRVFVSSTLRELEAERRAVRAAIEGLRLAPVMFELGARPHPPRDLYRAYLSRAMCSSACTAPATAGSRPGKTFSSRRRVRPGPRRHAEAHLPQRVHGARAESWQHCWIGSRRTTRSRTPRIPLRSSSPSASPPISRPSSPNASTVPAASRRMLHARPFGGCPRRTPRRSDVRTM